MVKAYDITFTQDYVLKSDTGEDPTVFSLGCLDSQIHSYLIDKSRSFGLNSNGSNAPASVFVNVEYQKYDIVQFGLRGWKNLQLNGQEVKFETISKSTPWGKNYTVASPRSMDFIKPYIDELASAIVSNNSVTKEDEKSFSLPPTV